MKSFIKFLFVITGLLLLISAYRGLTINNETKIDYLITVGYSFLILIILILQRKIKSDKKL